MAIEGTIQALLAPLAAGGCYPVVNTSPTPVTPYLIFQVISNVPVVSLDGPSGRERRRVQIDAWADTYKTVKDLELSVKSAMAGATFVNLPLLSQDLYEPDTKLFRVTMDFSVWQ